MLEATEPVAPRVGGSLEFEDFFGDFVPEFLDLADPGGGLAGFGEPIVGIADIAFDEVQQTVNPGAVAGVDVLRDVMGVLPIAFFGVPQCQGLPAESGRRGGVGQSGGLEFGGGHGGGLR